MKSKHLYLTLIAAHVQHVFAPPRHWKRGRQRKMNYQARLAFFWLATELSHLCEPKTHTADLSAFIGPIDRSTAQCHLKQARGAKMHDKTFAAQLDEARRRVEAAISYVMTYDAELVE
jgi:hypothetical protein